MDGRMDGLMAGQPAGRDGRYYYMSSFASQQLGKESNIKDFTIDSEVPTWSCSTVVMWIDY